VDGKDERIGAAFNQGSFIPAPCASTSFSPILLHPPHTHLVLDYTKAGPIENSTTHRTNLLAKFGATRFSSVSPTILVRSHL
jgi:hypothetical protein